MRFDSTVAAALCLLLATTLAARPNATAESQIEIGVAVGDAVAGEGEILVTGQENDIEAGEATDSITDVVEVRVVNVEVMVTDKQGQPITGLTRDDFELLEDGKPVELTNFYAVGMSAESGAGGSQDLEPASGPPESAAVVPRAVESHLVLYVDNLNIRPQNRKHLFEKLRDYLGERDGLPGQMMVVAMNHRIEVVQPFTRDLDRIYAAIDEIEKQGSLHALFDGSRRIFLTRLERASVRPYLPQRGSEGDPNFDDAIRVALEMSETVRALAEQRYQKVETTLEALGELCHTLGGLPGRKALVYLSDGLPLRPADSLIEAWTGKYQNWVMESQDDIRRRSRFPAAVAQFDRLSSSIGSSQFDLQSELNRLTTRANDNQVTFYPISKSGRALDYISAEHQGAVDYNSASMRRSMQTVENLTRDSSLLRMAEDTGGVALLRNVHIDKLLEQVDRDFGSFYSLGYQPPRAGEDFRFHRIVVRVRDPQARVRHIKGYRAKSWRQRLGEKTAAAALFAFESNPLDVRLAPGEAIPEGDVFRVPIMVKIPFQQIRLVHQDEHYNAQLTVLVQVSDENDGLSTTRRFDLPIKIPSGRVLEVLPQLAAYPLELIIPKGPHRVAIGIRDHLAQTEATVMYDLVVAQEAESDGGDPEPGETASDPAKSGSL